MRKTPFPFFYEGFLWLLYVCLFKYDNYLTGFPPNGNDFPHRHLIIYAICMTLYVIPFYRWLAPLLLKQKRYVLFFFTILFYFAYAGKFSGWVVSSLFTPLDEFYVYQQHSYFRVLFHPLKFWDLRLVVTDVIAFVSLAFMWYAFENERTRHLLEKDNLVLQLESLKAQLHPHFLFNTLNSIYAMSLTGRKEAPAYILKLSDMMRYILYDCKHNIVILEKDIEFLRNYIAMETARYPEAAIDFEINGEYEGKHIAPLLFIPFIENSFKHGGHRVHDKGFISGKLTIYDTHCHFVLANDYLTVPVKSSYGGVGIDNVKKRLQLYYPGKHQLQINSTPEVFQVELKLYF